MHIFGVCGIMGCAYFWFLAEWIFRVIELNIGSGAELTSVDLVLLHLGRMFL